MIKCFVSDLDGTLLNDKHCLSEKTVAALRQITAAGYEFIVATGREWESVYPLFEPYGIKFRSILINGAVVQDENAKVIQEIPLHLDTVKAIVKIMLEYNINVQLCTKDGNAAEDPDKIHNDFRERMMKIEGISEAEIEELLNNNHFFTFEIKIDDWDRYFAQNPVIYKIEAFSNNEEAMDAIRKRIMDKKDIDISDSIGKNFEVTHVNAQKGLALAKLIQTLGYEKEEVAVFGDGMNDFCMMKDFPNSYAMANAEERIKEVATYTIGNNDEDAVANEILRIVEANKNDA